MAKLVLSNNIEANQDSEDAMAEDDQVENYKGVFFGEETEQKYYEAGAHFSFKGLCKILESIIRTLSPSRRGKSLYGDEEAGDDKQYNYKLNKKDSVKVDPRKDVKEKGGSRNIKGNNLIPNNSLNNNNLSFLNKLTVKGNSKPSLLLTNKINLGDTISNFKSKNTQNSKNNLVMSNNYLMENSKQNDIVKKSNLEDKTQDSAAKSTGKQSSCFFKKIDPLLDKAKININRANSNMTSDKKPISKSKLLGNFNSNQKGLVSKKVSYVEKKEIYLHNKSKNSSIFNMSNNNDHSTLTKSLHNITQSKVQNSSKNEGNSSVKFELKNLDKLHKNKESELFRFITSSIDRIERLKDDKSKDVSPNNITSNTNNKTHDYNSPQPNKKDSKPETRAKNGQTYGPTADQISFEAKDNTNGMQDIFDSLGGLNVQGKSRNQQRNNFVKNNIFNSDKNPSFHSNTLQKNTMKEKSSSKQNGILPKNTFEIENRTVHKTGGNQKFVSNLTLNKEKQRNKKENGGTGVQFNNVANGSSFLTKVDNATKINFRINSKALADKFTITSTNIYNKIEVKKTTQYNSNSQAIKQTINKSISKERMVNVNHFLEDKSRAMKGIQDKTQNPQKNNSYYLKKSDFIGKVKGTSDNKATENNRKLSYDNKIKC